MASVPNGTAPSPLGPIPYAAVTSQSTIIAGQGAENTADNIARDTAFDTSRLPFATSQTLLEGASRDGSIPLPRLAFMRSRNCKSQDPPSTSNRSHAARANALLQQRLLFEPERLYQEGAERLTAAWLTQPPHHGAPTAPGYRRLRPATLGYSPAIQNRENAPAGALGKGGTILSLERNTLVSH